MDNEEGKDNVMFIVIKMRHAMVIAGGDRKMNGRRVIPSSAPKTVVWECNK
jgi:hypothetical protein